MFPEKVARFFFKLGCWTLGIALLLVVLGDTLQLLGVK